MNLVTFDPFRNSFPLRNKSLANWLLSDVGFNTANCASNEYCSTWSPAVDIREDEIQFVVTADIPGVNPKDIEVTIENGVLTIKGERATEKTEEKENYRRVERSHGTFMRRFAFPESVEADHVSAKGKDGVLEIVIPKKESVLPRKISVS